MVSQIFSTKINDDFFSSQNYRARSTIIIHKSSMAIWSDANLRIRLDLSACKIVSIKMKSAQYLIHAFLIFATKIILKILNLKIIFATLYRLCGRSFEQKSFHFLTGYRRNLYNVSILKHYKHYPGKIIPPSSED